MVSSAVSGVPSMKSRFTRRIWGLFAAAPFLPFAGATAQTYSVVDFATVIGGMSGAPTATAISADGSVTGYMVSSAIVFDGVTMTFLPSIGIESYGWGINADGQVTGGFTLPVGGGHTFLFSGGVMTDLGTLGGYSSIGYAVNDGGQTTGQSYITGNMFFHAFLYSN